MRFEGAPSWEIRSGTENALTLALYVRDAAGLSRYVLGEPDLPPLEPAVPVQVRDVDLRLAIREWERWWAQAVEPSPARLYPHPPDWVGLDDLPVMRALAGELFDGFRAWSAELPDERPHDALDLTRFVNGFEQTLGRRVRPFSLTIRQVPVAGPSAGCSTRTRCSSAAPSARTATRSGPSWNP